MASNPYHTRGVKMIMHVSKRKFAVLSRHYGYRRNGFEIRMDRKKPLYAIFVLAERDDVCCVIPQKDAAQFALTLSKISIA